MTDISRPTKRTKYSSTSVLTPSRWLTSDRHDFSSTFDILVGQLPGNVQRFTVHTDVLTRRSRFFAAARKHEWIAGEEAKPVDLSDEDPEVFQTYLNCVYIGPETLKGIGGAFEREVRRSAEGLSELFVYNICKDVTTKMLVQRCERFGEIKMAKIATLKAPHHGSPRAARIVFATAEAGEAAMEFFHGLIFHGHRLTVHASFKGIGDLLDHWSLRFEVADRHYDTLMRLYLLADKLQDLATANITSTASTLVLKRCTSTLLSSSAKYALARLNFSSAQHMKTVMRTQSPNCLRSVPGSRAFVSR